MVHIRQVFFFFIIAALLAACGGGGAKATPTLVPTPVMVEKPVYTVQRGTVTKTIQLTGRVTPIQQQDLFFHSDGVVQEVLVQAGDSVKADAVLARLDEPEQHQADVAAAQLAYVQAQRNLAQVRLDTPAKLAEAKQALEAATQTLEKAQAALDALKYPHVTDKLTLEKFRTDYAIAKQDYEDAQGAYDAVSGWPQTNRGRADALNTLLAARRAYYQAMYNLNWAEGKITQAEIDEKQVALDLAKANSEKAVAEVQRWVTDSPTSELAMARLTLTDAEARFNLAKRVQQAVELRAPFAGQVLSLGVAPGSTVKAFQAVLTLANPSKLEIRAIPAVEDLTHLGMGQVAALRLSSQAGKQWTARITNLPMAANSAVSDAPQQDASIHLRPDDAAAPLTLGDAAAVSVTVDRRENVLWLPPAALRQFQGEPFVFVETGGVQRRVNVTLGVQSAERVEITSGLEEGQKVVGQ
jgi:multidrug efflux pump subunit AcrA (membrane-fusion protein)